MLELLLSTASSSNSSHVSTLVSNYNWQYASCDSGNTKGKLSPIWILDFGATDHFTTSLSFYTSYKSIKPIYVRLPNGNLTSASYSGNVVFNDSISLYNVLYIPMFPYNIVSVSKLLEFTPCTLTFSNTSGVIQDLKILKMIGNATLCHGLYELVSHHSNTHDAPRTAPSIHVVDTFTPIFPLTHDCHYRLGHPSSTCYTNVTKNNFMVLPINLSHYATFPSKRSYLFLLVILFMILFLILFMLIYGDLLLLLLFMVINIF